MRGRERARKKHIKRAGWQIVGERNDRERRSHSLLLRGPGGEEVTVGASSRPRAYVAAEATIAVRQRETNASRAAASHGVSS
jgi:hypothetical protein